MMRGLEWHAWQPEPKKPRGGRNYLLDVGGPEPVTGYWVSSKNEWFVSGWGIVDDGLPIKLHGVKRWAEIPGVDYGK